MQDAKEEVRSRLNIEDVVGEYVQLKRAGRNFKGLSPFTSEKTPSFVVSPEKQIWHDFSSNRGGDVFSFIMEVEALDFRAALEFLARKAGVDLSLYQSSGDQRLAKRKKRATEANKLAARYFQASLVKNKSALSYVSSKRGLTRETIKDFEIGYAPDTQSGLVDLLKGRGFSQEELKSSGLVNRYNSDLFRGRMMVALMNESGEVIGFTGRILKDVPNAPKYLNTPETILYDKSRHVFALSQAKEAIRENDFVVIVEGNMDAVSSHQAGVKQVVATAGTAMTENHLKTLKRLTNDIRLCFDGDKAGIAATERAIEIASSIEVDLSIISLEGTGAKDPDELIIKDRTSWLEVINRPLPAVDWVLRQYQARFSLSTASGKRQFTTEALKLIERLQDSVEREHYYQVVAGIVGTSVGAILNKIKVDAGQERHLKQAKNTINTAEIDYDLSRQDDILSIASISTQARRLLSGIDENDFQPGPRREALIGLRSSEEDLTSKIPKNLQSIETYVKMVQLRADTRFESHDEASLYEEMTRLIRLLEYEKNQKLKNQLVEDLRVAESSGDETTATELRLKLNTLIKEIQRAR